jgi:hypothetical protein
MKLKGNTSATENWDLFFQTGGHDKSGYLGCLPNPDRGPCAKVFEGKECPYYPKLPMSKIFYPACCDGDGCFCECTYYCMDHQGVFTSLAMSIKDKEFDGCTTRVKTLTEAAEWKHKQCNATNNGDDYKALEKRCRKRKSKTLCVGNGKCVKDICKSCYRYYFKNIFEQLDKIKLRLLFPLIIRTYAEEENCEAIF